MIKTYIHYHIRSNQNQIESKLDTKKIERTRIKEFGRLALNSMLANNLIWDIQEAYHLNETDLEKEGEDFE